MKIYYLGPAGSFSEIVVRNRFKKEDSFIPLQSFSEIVKKTEEDVNSIGALVIENSISSSVHVSVDLMYKSNVSIIGETFMKMQMDIIGLPGANLKTVTDVYSHVQALSQCSNYIQNKFTAHEMQSTSEAAEFIKNSKDNTKGAIGSKYLADKLNLKILDTNIANEKHNLSRWIFVKKSMESLSKEINKVTYIFKVKHEPGSLVKVLQRISDEKGNVTKIESRPLPGTDWEYGFWIDVEIPENSVDVFRKIMDEETIEYRVVGIYAKGVLINI
jgi:prephenate dehydratase